MNKETESGCTKVHFGKGECEKEVFFGKFLSNGLQWK